MQQADDGQALDQAADGLGGGQQETGKCSAAEPGGAADMGERAELAQGQALMMKGKVKAPFQQVPHLCHQVGQVVIRANVERLGRRRAWVGHTSSHRRSLSLLSRPRNILMGYKDLYGYQSRPPRFDSVTGRSACADARNSTTASDRRDRRGGQPPCGGNRRCRWPGVEQWLVFGLAASVVVWVGGAISGQLILARILDTAGGSEVLTYLRQLLWIIPRIYVPAGFLALACGLGLAARTDVAFTSAQVVVPVALYTMTAVAGAAISAPGYVRLVRLADRAGPDHPDIRRRLQPLAWLNRVELTLVLSVGFVLIASVA